ncbi:hypothetical protein Hanom_Chr17g01567021 [Helianthus anomalus]
MLFDVNFHIVSVVLPLYIFSFLFRLLTVPYLGILFRFTMPSFDVLEVHAYILSKQERISLAHCLCIEHASLFATHNL